MTCPSRPKHRLLELRSALTIGVCVAAPELYGRVPNDLHAHGARRAVGGAPGAARGRGLAETATRNVRETTEPENQGMSVASRPRSRRNRAAALTFAATILFFIAGLALLVAVGSLAWPLAVFFIAEISFPAVGLFILHRGGNRVGWIFLLAGFGLALLAFSSGYAEYALVYRTGALPAATVVAWLGELVWLPQLVLATMFLFLLFPDGRLLSRRWRKVADLGVVGVLLIEASVLFEPTLYSYPKLRAPLAGLLSETSINVLASVGSLVLLPAMLLALGSVVVRYRRAESVARQQIKWFTYAAAAFLAAQIAFNVLELGRDNVIAQVLSGLSALLIPGSVAIAISKYRLYDIDVIINRTLVYGLLTASLAAIYATLIVVSQTIVLRAGATEEVPDVAVAASTLAAAALFQPLRRRIQGFIDRRFYRRKYDAARTLDAFAARLRDEVNLETLRIELLSAVGNTVQPAHVSLWLRN